EFDLGQLHLGKDRYALENFDFLVEVHDCSPEFSQADAINSAYSPPRAASSDGAPWAAILPPCMTTICSNGSAWDGRLAIQITPRSPLLAAARMLSRMRSWVRPSNDATASFTINSCGRLMMARAMPSFWRWVADSRLPPTPTL